MAEAPQLTRVLRREEVERLTGMKRTALRDMTANGEFPKPIKLNESGRAIGWLEDELIAWQHERAANGRTLAR